MTTTVYYTFTVFNDAGARQSGLTPTITTFQNIASGAAITPVPTISAIGTTGDYYFALTSDVIAANGDIYALVNTGQSGVSDANNKITITVARETPNVITNLDSQVSAVQTGVTSANTSLTEINTATAATNTTLGNATYGLSALNTVLGTINTTTGNTNTAINNSTYGLSALNTSIGTLLTDITAVGTSLTTVLTNLALIPGNVLAAVVDSATGKTSITIGSALKALYAFVNGKRDGTTNETNPPVFQKTQNYYALDGVTKVASITIAQTSQGTATGTPN